jgi:hypothetical protein
MCLEDGEELDDQWAHLPRSADDGFGAEYRRQLLLLNRERIEFSYEKARNNGLPDAIILVLDLLDERAARMSQMVGVPWDQIERCRDECSRLDVVPVHVIPVPQCAALCVVGPSTPRSPQGVAKPCAPGTFRVIAIAAGGNSFADFPLPPVADLEGE